MANNKWQRVIAFVCAASFLVTSCSSLHRVSIPGSETSASIPAVQVGDSVVVTTRTGEEKKFKVTAIDPDALVGKDVRVLYADMASLSLKHYTTSNTALAILIIGAIAAVVIGVVATKDAVEETVGL